MFLWCWLVSYISVRSVSYDFDRYELIIDIETANIQPPGGNKEWVIHVIGWYSRYVGSVLAEYSFVPNTRFVARVVASPLYLYRGASVQLVEYTIDPEGGRWPGVLQSVGIDTSNLDGIKRYWSWRGECLSRAVWRFEASLRLFDDTFPGGFIAIYMIVVNSAERAVYIDITVDGTTRYYDIYSCWFGVPGRLFAKVGQTRLSTVRVDLSSYWNDFLGSGLVVQPRDYSGYLVDGFTVKPSEMWLPSRVTLTTDKDVYVPGEEIGATSMLEYLDIDGQWRPLANMPLNICIDTQCTQVATGSDGRARWAVKAPEKPGTYTLKSEFQGA
jgi:hypothetical protein